MSLTSFVILATAIAGATAQSVMVNTPTSVVQCLPVQLSWSGGQPPYFLSLIPGGQPSGTPLEDLGQQTGTSYSWKADLPANTAVTVQIRDSTGVLNYSDQFTVQKAPSGVTCGSSGSTPASTATPSTSTGAASTPSKNATSSTTPTTPTTGSTTGSTTAGGASTTNTTSTPHTGSTAGNTTPVAGTNTTGSSASTEAKGDASRPTAGIMAVALAAAVAVFA
ncbi:secreted protein [Melampsora americana]|nr:secreted protein [Melampsora americana]